MALFLALMEIPNSKGYTWKQYIEAVVKYNADQIYRQTIINIQQNKENNIDDGVYQNIIKKQQNTKLCINDDKISGAVDNQLIGINNLVKAEGIKRIDSDPIVEFVATEDEVTTQMCHSLNGQKFRLNNWNEFTRYSAESKTYKRYRCKGLVLGLNLPPINDHYHCCRSIIVYLPQTEEKDISFDSKGNIIVNGFKVLSNKELNKINRVALLKNLNRMEKVFKDFPILKDRNIKYKVVKVNDNSAMAVIPTTKEGYILEINENIFNSDIKEYYIQGSKINDNPKGTTYKDIGIHEAGHMVSFEVIRKTNKSNLKTMEFDYDNNITTDNIMRKAFDNLKIYDKIQKENSVKRISNYALTDSSEAVAEAFADYYCNKEKANILSKEVIKVVKGMMKN